MWGLHDSGAIAEALGRGVAAVEHEARKLLGHRSRGAGTETIEALVKRSGYHRSTIFLVAKRLGIQLRRMPRDVARGLRAGGYAVTFDQAEAILADLAQKPDGRRAWLVRREEWRGPHGERCRGADCGTVDRPHFAKGMCSRCYWRAYRLLRRAAPV